MIEHLTAAELEQLDAGEYRWKIDRNNYFGLLQLVLQRKGWFLWRNVQTHYPEFCDERKYTSPEQYREGIERYKVRLLEIVTRTQRAAKANDEFFRNA